MSAVGLAPGSADGKRDLTLDAIIVPASRPAHHLEQAVDLAQATRCALLILCSRHAATGSLTSLALVWRPTLMNCQLRCSARRTTSQASPPRGLLRSDPVTFQQDSSRGGLTLARRTPYAPASTATAILIGR